ncbi:S41 family peptidase [Salinicoccus siamensis]|uniref:Probable CtpA-like serine protease n=1 Tax=Salinicoccus siamensis TaxID=381830 RepID=A0ABV5Z393_9STAP
MKEEHDSNNSRKVGGKHININFFWFLIIILTSIILSAVITALSLEAGNEKAVNVGTDTRSEFSKLYSVYDTITDNYYEDVDRNALIESSIQGMVEGLDDPYSEYMNNEEIASFEESVSGDFEGIGAEVMQEGSRIIITSPMRGSPAEEAGVEPGDEILAVDDEPVEGMNVQEAVQLIRGEKGTDVTLTLARNEGDPFEITITRDTIHIDSVTYEEVDGVGHISINRFQRGTNDEFEAKLNEAAEANIEDLIIDFRYNPGGLLDEAVGMINQFVDEGETVLYLEENGGERKEITAPGPSNDNTDDFNLYILINEGSASASEVFTGAMDDLTDVTIAGTESFGKGIVQQTIEFGDDSLLKYTDTKWLTPEGDWIHEKGITPDIRLLNPDYYRVEMLGPDEVFTEGISDESVPSIKVALDTLGYPMDDFDESYDKKLTKTVKKFQADNDLDQTGNVTGETATAIMSELRTYINENDAQLNYLVDYINGEFTRSEIEKYAKEHAEILEIQKPEEDDSEESSEESPDEEDTEE